MDLLFTKAGAVLVAIFLALLGVIGYQVEYGTQKTVTFTVQSLDDQATTHGHKYLIFATDGSVYENTDAWLHGKTDSSNLWAKFLAGGQGATWKCPVYGIRNTLFSSYPDILDGCDLLSQGTPISVG